jgi:hypothetical protein
VRIRAYASGLAVTRREEEARKPVLGGVDTATWKWFRRWESVNKDIVQQPNRIGYVYRSVVVGIGCIEAGRRSTIAKNEKHCVDSIHDVEFAV